ncbi:glycerate kinase [Polaribacter undariae]|uniref:Glycerate kinase n=1 Tax=Polaribacter sejongensis TaxID=985043 RepID=A0AAJ1QZF5_9FLAO|nr:glycerate kinase [Polaribacter undariae]MDN3621066.1 glycerate kinase [Polaribacter undariae]UWD33705.1 glycerate kinase [Polaribacter undariae]
MKIVLAPDKFKNSLTGLEFCNIVEKGILEEFPNAEILKLPLADGGDGTIEVVEYYLKGRTINVTVNNPFFEVINASYIYSKENNTAFIEMAEASGVKLLKPSQFDCKNATTLGTGEMIADAINKGAKTIIMGIGGSATNDCGIGMATALGYQFLDKNNEKVKPIGANLSNIKSIDVTNVHPKLSAVDFKIACDVTNPLYGKNGAAYVYGAQKGASKDEIVMLDKGLQDFSEILNAIFTIDVQSVKGAGAAGGMGIASKLFLNGTLEPGIQLIKNIANFDTQIEGADWIITGEGKLDTQTMSGKTIQGVLTSATAKKIKVAAFCGAIDLDGKQPEDFGIQYTDAVINYAKDLEDSMKNSAKYLNLLSRKFALKKL